MFSGE